RRRHTRFSRDWSSDVCFPIYLFTGSCRPFFMDIFNLAAPLQCPQAGPGPPFPLPNPETAEDRPSYRLPLAAEKRQRVSVARAAEPTRRRRTPPRPPPLSGRNAGKRAVALVPEPGIPPATAAPHILGHVPTPH